jgi:putative FmdB family regulatory protein
MPIYAYRCGACGHSRDVLQKLSDPLLTVCPACGAEAFSKQVTAAGFQLKGSGWYVTDFRDNGSAKKPGSEKSEGADSASTSASDKAAAQAESGGSAATSASPAPAPTPAAAPAPAPAAAAAPASQS